MLMIILIVLLVLVLFGAIPAYRYHPVYGGGGISLVGLILVILLIMVLVGRI